MSGRSRRSADEALDAHVARVPGTAVYLFKDAGAAPPALVSNLAHNQVLHENTLLLSVGAHRRCPRVRPDDRVAYTAHRARHPSACGCRSGSWTTRRARRARRHGEIPGYPFDLGTTTYFLGREAVGAGKAPGMHPAEQLFVLLNRGAASAVAVLQPAVRPGLRGRHAGRDLTPLAGCDRRTRRSRRR